MLTSMDRDKMSRLKQFTGQQSAIDYEKYATRSATTGEIRDKTNLLGLLTNNPMNMILGAGAGIVKNYSDKQITNLMDNVYASQEYQNYMKDLDKQYTEYQDYDVYNDYRGVPNYRDEKGYLDVRPGTVFDAEDHGEPPSPPQDKGVQVGDNYQDSSDDTDYGVDMGGPAYDY